MIANFVSLVVPDIPLGVIMALLAVALPGAAFLGHSAGQRRRDAAHEESRETLARSGETTVGAILALLGLLLAFSFGNALSWAEARKAVILEEANALGTAFLRADVLPEPGRTELKGALLDYAQTRLLPPGRLSDGGMTEALEATLAAQARLWPMTMDVTEPPIPSPMRSFVSGSINDVIDVHSERLASLNRPEVELVWIMLVAAAVTGLFLVGNRSGLQGRPLTWRTFLFAGFLWIVMVTIGDLQRGTEGVIRTNDGFLSATILSMQADLDGPDPG